MNLSKKMWCVYVALLLTIFVIEVLQWYTIGPRFVRWHLHDIVIVPFLGLAFSATGFILGRYLHMEVVHITGFLAIAPCLLGELYQFLYMSGDYIDVFCYFAGLVIFYAMMISDRPAGEVV